MIGLSIAQSIVMRLDLTKTSAEIRKWLCDTYEKQGEGKVFYMLTEVTSLKYEGGDLRTHIDKMERLFDNIAASDKKFELNIGLHKLFLYKSLGPDWREFVDNILSRDLEWADVVTKLLERELRNRDDESAAVEQANFTKRKSYRGKGGAKDLGDEIKRNQCRNCKEFGHWAYRCPKKKGKKKYQANMANNDSSKELTLAEEVLCAQTKVEGFIVDSGCTSVMIKDKGMLYDCKKSSGSVQLGSKTEILIGAVGALALEVGAKRELPEVLHVPNLRRNLLSVSKLADLGIVTVFDRNKVVFYESGAKIKGARLAQGLKSGNLYKFKIQQQEAMLSEKDKKKAMLWHNRLAHVNYGTLKKLPEFVKGLDGLEVEGSIVEGSKSLLTESKITKRFWEQEVGVTVKIQNCLITSALDKKTPYELWHGRKPNLEKFRFFGCTCYVQVPKQKRRKFDDKSQHCVFMGYGSDGNGYKCWDPIAKKMLVSSDVAFAERDIPGDRKGLIEM
ncbi:hypothetical protein R1sor_023326 [Riccia sorocarpa]|uniref:CCHC-type domain-containing protein n=1 Tax=Riccia sorocarpa TaxID=122646 RepID=A0ABD3GMB5_9MARC